MAQLHTHFLFPFVSDIPCVQLLNEVKLSFGILAVSCLVAIIIHFYIPRVLRNVTKTNTIK